ncbi:MAG: amidohydrolase [Acetatifactor sp.]|nr:amidohydrolase [Acetatifactor sp.]
MNIRLYNALILTMEPDSPVFAGEIWVKNDKIAYIANRDELSEQWNKLNVPRIKWDLELDCKGNLLMPGFKDAHTHSAMTFLRSFADDLPLQEWLNDKVFPMEAKLTADDIYDFTRLAILEYLTSGITSIFDMYLNPDAVAEACLDIGMRCCLVGGLNNFTSSIHQMEDEFLKWNKTGSLINYQLGFHAEYTCSKELLCGVSELAHHYKAPVYTHMSENIREVEDCKKRNGVTPVTYLDSLGVFDFGGGGFHCVHVTEQDMNLMQMRRLSVVTNPASNLKLASGIAPIAEFVKRKIPVAIGTDGPASNNCLDMFREMFLVTALSKYREDDAASMDALNVLCMATTQGARVMNQNKCDSLAVGKCADIIMIDMHQPNMQPVHNISKNLVYSGSKSNIKMTMIGGKVLYLDGHFNIGEDVEYLYKKCNAIVKRICNSTFLK